MFGFINKIKEQVNINPKVDSASAYASIMHEQQKRIEREMRIAKKTRKQTNDLILSTQRMVEEMMR